MYQLNADCEEFLRKALRKEFRFPDSAAPVSLEEAMLVMFFSSMILVRNMKAFIEVRKGKADKLPTKGKLAEAKAGVHNLIWINRSLLKAKRDPQMWSLHPGREFQSYSTTF